jgi:hypothetical protein
MCVPLETGAWRRLLLLLLLPPGVPHKPLATRWTRSTVATAAEDDALHVCDTLCWLFRAVKCRVYRRATHLHMSDL